MSRTHHEPTFVPADEFDRPPADVVDGDVVERPADLAVLSAQTRGEIDVQIATAKRFPRSIAAFRKSAIEMATLDEETASGCRYVLPPRDGKQVSGPSVRLAEIALIAWGNVRADARIIEIGEKNVTAEGVCWDLERNVAVRIQVNRRITTKTGKRYGDDMIGMTCNAACAIALRNAVFKVIPMAMTRPIYDAAYHVALGDASTLGQRRERMLAHFEEMGVKPKQVFDLLGVRGVEDITLEHLATMKGLATAIRDGDTTIEQAFAKPDEAASAAARVAAAAAGAHSASTTPPTVRPSKAETPAQNGTPAPTKPQSTAAADPEGTRRAEERIADVLGPAPKREPAPATGHPAGNGTGRVELSMDDINEVLGGGS